MSDRMEPLTGEAWRLELAWNARNALINQQLKALPGRTQAVTNASFPKSCCESCWTKCNLFNQRERSSTTTTTQHTFIRQYFFPCSQRFFLYLIYIGFTSVSQITTPCCNIWNAYRPAPFPIQPNDPCGIFAAIWCFLYISISDRFPSQSVSTCFISLF